MSLRDVILARGPDSVLPARQRGLTSAASTLGIPRQPEAVQPIDVVGYQMILTRGVILKK